MTEEIEMGCLAIALGVGGTLVGAVYNVATGNMVWAAIWGIALIIEIVLGSTLASSN